MQIIVPLAGPDFISNGKVKAEIDYHGTPLLLAALNSRPWWNTRQQLIFILRDQEESRKFVQRSLSIWFPDSKVVFLSNYTNGASLSALSGLGLIDDFLNTTVCIDLADILYSCDSNPAEIFNKVENLGALIPSFNSSLPQYSYLELDNYGNITRAEEKNVISNHASAGTYFFRNTVTYMTSLVNILKSNIDYRHNSLHYVCPVVNGVLSIGYKAQSVTVSDVVDIKSGHVDKEGKYAGSY